MSSSPIFLRWLLLAVLALWSVALAIVAVALMTDSYGGMGPVPLVIAGCNLVAALPFLTAMGPTMVIVARVVAVAQGVAIIASGYLLSEMAATIVSMGNSHGSGFTPLMGLTTVVGIGLILLAIFAPAVSTG